MLKASNHDEIKLVKYCFVCFMDFANLHLSIYAIYMQTKNTLKQDLKSIDHIGPISQQ